MPPLSERQSAVLDLICACVGWHKFPPTIREIAGRFGIRPPENVSRHVHSP